MRTIFSDKRVVIRYCGNAEIHESAYLEITNPTKAVVVKASCMASPVAQFILQEG